MKDVKISIVVAILLLAVPSLTTADEGVFVDNPVSGLRYETPTLSGHTNVIGEFQYSEGETVQFYLGSLLLGEAPGRPMINPIDLVQGAIDETDPAVTNICRLLQSLDHNITLDDGISIGPAAREEMEGRQINFDQNPADFGNDPEVAGLFDALNSRSYYGGGETGSLISAEKAQYHLRATLLNWNKSTSPLSTDLETGFPIGFSGYNGTYRSGPSIHCLVGDVDGDVQKEIIVSGIAQGPLYALKVNEALFYTFGPVGGVSYPALARLDSDSPGLDTVFGMSDVAIYAFSSVESIISGWPRDPGNFITSPPATADVDGDGIDEIFMNEEDGCIHAYKADGTLLPGWPFRAPIDSSWGQEFSNPAIGDIDDDGELEIVAVNETKVIYALDADGTLLDGFPIAYPGHVNSYPAIGDVDGDGDYEIVVGSYASDYSDQAILVVSKSGIVEHTIDLSYHTVFYGSAPALADLDADGSPEIVYQTEAFLFVFKHENGSFTPMAGWPQRVSKISNPSKKNSSPVIGDIDGDGYPEIVVTVRNSFSGGSEDEIRAYELDGTLHQRFPKKGRLGDGGTPAISDVDADCRNEIIVRGDDGTYNPLVYVYDLGGESHGGIEWAQFGRDFRHSSYYPKPRAGNVNGDGKVDTADFILSLQISAGVTTSESSHLFAEVNGDNKIGLEESLYILHKISRLRRYSSECDPVAQ